MLSPAVVCAPKAAEPTAVFAAPVVFASNDWLPIAVKPEPVVETEVVNQKDFTSMTKSELEEFGRTIGIELDKRQTKVQLISELETFIESK